MHSLHMLAAAVLLTPITAQAESEYTACLKAQHESMGPMAVGNTPVRPVVYINRYIDSTYNFAPASYRAPTVVSFGSADMAANRFSALARACRQYRKTTTPRFKVVAIKTPALRNTGIRSP